MNTYGLILRGIETIEFPKKMGRNARALVRRLCASVLLLIYRHCQGSMRSTVCDHSSSGSSPSLPPIAGQGRGPKLEAQRAEIGGRVLEEGADSPLLTTHGVWGSQMVSPGTCWGPSSGGGMTPIKSAYHGAYVYDTVGRPSVHSSHYSPAARRRGGFAAAGSAGRRYGSISARQGAWRQQQMRAVSRLQPPVEG